MHRLKTWGSPHLRREEYSRCCQLQSIDCMICFIAMRFFTVFDIQADKASALFFGVRLFVVTKRVLHSKTWMEHCILAEVGVCYRSVG